MKKRWLLLPLGALAGAGFLYWHSVPLVETAGITRGLAVEAVYATGVVEPVQAARVAPLAPARLIALYRQEGDVVKAGEVLARLDDREAGGRIEELRARRDFLARERERQAALVAQNFVSKAALDRADSELAQAVAALAAASRPLAETRLRAPVDGIVLRQDGEVGEMLAAGQVVYWVGQPEPLRISADVDEEDILRVSIGQKVLIKADALPGEVLSGTVSSVTGKGDAINKNYRVRIALPPMPDPKRQLRTGMTAEINLIVRETENARLVPTRTLSGTQLWVLEEGRAARREVRLGVKGQAQTEILGELPDDLVLIVAPAGLRPGDRVRSAAR